MLHRHVPAQLHFTDSDEANALIATDPMGLLVGFALDQQVTVQKAFLGPLAIKERLGALDAATLAEADLETVFRERPAVHRYPAAMGRRVGRQPTAGLLQLPDTADSPAATGLVPGDDDVHEPLEEVFLLGL